MKRAILLFGVLLTGCAGQVDAGSQAPMPESCTLAALQPQDIAAVQPLWVPNKLVKSPAYTLGGVIVELQGGEGAVGGLAERAGVEARDVARDQLPLAPAEGAVPPEQGVGQLVVADTCVPLHPEPFDFVPRSLLG